MLTNEPDYGTFLIMGANDEQRNWRSQFRTAWLTAEAKARGQTVEAAFDAVHQELNRIGSHSADRWITDNHVRQTGDADAAMLVHLTTVAPSATDRELREAAVRLRADAILILKRAGGSGNWSADWLDFPV